MKLYKSYNKKILWFVLPDYLPFIVGLLIVFLLWLLN